ncbi:MAG: hypothetical protein ACRDF8_02780, partial [Chloroflexota bacterium]
MNDIAAQWPFALVPREDLVGREAVISEIIDQLIASRRSVLLAAPRRLGKSSVAQEAVRRLEADHNCLVARLDFFQLTSKRAIAEELDHQLLAASHRLASKARRLARATRNMAVPIPVFRRDHLEIDVGINRGREQSDDDKLRTALELGEQLAVSEKRLCVVLMDEFQEVGKTCGQQIYGFMRAIFQQQPNTKQIFAGSRQHLLRELFGAPGKAFLRYAREVPLPDVAIDQWVPYIVMKFRATGVECSPAAARRIGEITGGHPADTMELCDQLSVATRRTDKHVIDDALLEVALWETERVLRNVFEPLWEDLGDV